MAAVPASGSPNTFIFEVSNVITPEQPSATVTLWASFHPDLFAFRETRTEVLTEFDRGWFSDPAALLDPWGYSEAGDVSPDGDRVSDVYVMQIYVPFSVFPTDDNPIHLWSVNWTTDDFSSRQVDLSTHTESFRVYHADGGSYEQVGIDFAEGSGVITVVPAPAGTTVLAGAGALAARRRRRVVAEAAPVASPLTA